MFEFDNGTVAHSTLREPEPFDRAVEGINWPVKGTVVSVHHSDAPNNAQGQTLYDVLLIDYNYFISRIPIFALPFHQDTQPGRDFSRQTRTPRERNIFTGESFTAEVGTIVLVQFIGPPGANREAAITGFCPVSNQSLPHQNRQPDEPIFPKEAQAVTTFDATGELTEEFRSRLQPTHGESPRYTRIQNGSAFEIDNRGNINLQSTINRDAIQRERYDNYKYDKAKIDEAPLPEGNIVLSTRGARRGNIGLATGRITAERRTMPIYDASGNVTKEVVLVDALDEQNEEGNVTISTSGAAQGKITITTEQTLDGTITLIDTGQSQVRLDGKGGVSVSAVKSISGDAGGAVSFDAGGNFRVTVGGTVNLGKANATRPVVLGDSLMLWILTNLLTHIHYGVESGRSCTLMPNLILPDILSQTVFVSK